GCQEPRKVNDILATLERMNSPLAETLRQKLTSDASEPVRRATATAINNSGGLLSRAGRLRSPGFTITARALRGVSGLRLQEGRCCTQVRSWSPGRSYRRTAIHPRPSLLCDH